MGVGQDEPPSGVGCEQVPGEHPPHGTRPLSLGILGVQSLAGIGAQQVVEVEAVVRGLAEQVGGGEAAQAARRGRVGVQQRRGGADADVGSGVQAEEPEGAAPGFAQGAVGPGERRAHVAQFVFFGRQGVEPVPFVLEFGDQVGEGQFRSARRVLGDDAQCERKVAAEFGDAEGGQGSAAIRSVPSTVASRATDSSGDSTSKVTRAAPSLATSPASVLRLVISAKHPRDAGSSGLMSEDDAALSRTTSMRLPSRSVR